MRPVTNVTVISAPIDHIEMENKYAPMLIEWQNWQRQTLPGRSEFRDIVVERLKDSLMRRTPTLDLSGLQLTTLPNQLPDFLEELIVNRNHLAFLPNNLPESLIRLNVSVNRLRYLPEHLPSCLEELEIRSNQLTILPHNLPDSLKRLYASDNQLLCLPDTLPVALQELYINRNRLVNLPANLPPSLAILKVSGNQLTRLPETLPVLLKLLNVSFNQLSVLPDSLPSSLKTLNLHHNLLLALPENLPDGLRVLTIRYNQLNHLPDNLPDSLLSLDMNEIALVHRYANSLDFIGKIYCWDRNIDKEQWRKIQLEENALVFADFLHKLHRGKNGQQNALHRRVADWLKYLADNDHSELRQQTFLLAHEAAENCVDRASFYFTKMHILMVEHKLINTAAPLTQVVETIRATFRLQVLERIAAEKAAARQCSSPGFTEDLEIYLAYQYKLREPLSLPIYTELQFEQLAGLTDEDIQQAKKTVADAEKADFVRYWLMESALWTVTLANWDPVKKAEADSQYLEAISAASFKAAVDSALCDKGIAVDDTDAHRDLSKTLAETLLYEQRYLLTRECLAAHQALFLLDQYDSPSLKKV